MKNIYILFMLLCFVTVNAQDTESTAPKSKSGADILPAAGDIAIGADALPYLNYLGNMFNNTVNNTLVLGQNNLYFRYFLDDQSAVRVNILINSTTNIQKQYVQDDAARFADPLSQAQVVDKRTTSNNGYSFVVGYMMTRAHGRLSGFYGAQVGYGFFRNSIEYQYGNNITVANAAPTVYDFGFGAAINKAERDKEYDSGINQTIGAGLFAGVEYYFLPKVCIGGEVGLGYNFNWGSQENAKTEKLVGTAVEEIEKAVSPGNKVSALGTNRPATYGGLYLMFHF